MGEETEANCLAVEYSMKKRVFTAMDWLMLTHSGHRHRTAAGGNANAIWTQCWLLRRAHVDQHGTGEGSGQARLPFGCGSESVRLRRGDAGGMDRGADAEDQRRHSDHANAGAHPGDDRDDGDDARSTVR